MARILIVEDNKMQREMVRELLEYAGHNVREALDGIVALHILCNDKKTYDVVITDLIMPNKNGMELIADIRRDYPGIKIVVVSGGDEKFSASSYLRASKNMGADHVLSKPFRNQELLKVIDEVLAAK
jgi:CheY-like chemotaxis protein